MTDDNQGQVDEALLEDTLHQMFKTSETQLDSLGGIVMGEMSRTHNPDRNTD